LGKAPLLSVGADFVAQNATMMWFRQHVSFTRTGTPQPIHTLYCVFMLACFGEKI
jgi:hypothetical protein